MIKLKKFQQKSIGLTRINPSHKTMITPYKANK